MSPTFNAFSVAQSIKTNIESLNLKLVPIDSYNSKDLENRNENIPLSVHLFPQKDGSLGFPKMGFTG